MTEVDTATCFGIYHSSAQDCLVSHGECEITRLAPSGHVEWQSSGRDIFTGTFRLFDDHVEVVDFNGDKYRVDLILGDIEVFG